MTILIKNIGEFFTGDLARPMLPVKSILIENGKIAALDPAEQKADKVLDAAGGAVMPGLVDGHVHPMLGEWTPAQELDRLDRQLSSRRHHQHDLGRRTACSRHRL